MLTKEQYEHKAIVKTGYSIRILRDGYNHYYRWYNYYINEWLIPHAGTFKTESECYEHWVNNFSKIVFRKVDDENELFRL